MYCANGIKFKLKPLDSGKSFFDISVNNDQIDMGCEEDTQEKCKHTIFSDFRTKFWLKSY